MGWYPIECEHGYDCCPTCDGPRRDPKTLKVVARDDGDEVTDWQCPNCKRYQYKAYGFECDECGTKCPAGLK